MSEPQKKVSLNLSETEYSAIKALFNHSDWDFESCVITNEFEESVAVEISEDILVSEHSDRTEVKLIKGMKGLNKKEIVFPVFATLA